MLSNRSVINKNVIFDELASFYYFRNCGGHLGSGLPFAVCSHSCYKDNLLMVLSALVERILESTTTHTLPNWELLHYSIKMAELIFFPFLLAPSPSSWFTLATCRDVPEFSACCNFF